jgi:type I restriction enzyme M protein
LKKHAELDAPREAEGADPEDPDEYRAANIFWVPKEARWQDLQANAKQPTIGSWSTTPCRRHRARQPSLKGVLPKDYARPASTSSASASSSTS